MASKLNRNPGGDFYCGECVGLCTHGPLVPIADPEWMTCEAGYCCAKCGVIYGRDDACRPCRDEALRQSRTVRLAGINLH
jgi:hypothetical protein